MHVPVHCQSSPGNEHRRLALFHSRPILDRESILWFNAGCPRRFVQDAQPADDEITSRDPWHINGSSRWAKAGIPLLLGFRRRPAVGVTRVLANNNGDDATLTVSIVKNLFSIFRRRRDRADSALAMTRP